MKRCYLCDSDSELTRDHIPPKSFFAPPLPDDLITVPCCRTCHDKLKLDDEAFRAFIACHQGISEQGMWIYREKVLGSTLKRSPALARNIIESMGKVEVTIDGERRNLPTVSLPRDRGNRFLERLTKGMLAKFYPTIPRNQLSYNISKCEPDQEIVDYLYKRFSHGQRGNGAFRFWHGVVETEDEQKGLWVFVFYDKGAFLVVHSNREI